MVFSGSIVPQPVRRSSLRRWAGRQFYRTKRYLQWHFTPKRFAKKKALAPLPHLVIAHKSMLLRPLKNVDMQLQHNKITNLRLAIDKIGQVLIQPGETFSFWYLVGMPTAKKGYKEGLVLKEGTISSGIGGGLCQLGNLIYWMVIHSPLVVKERYRHGYDVFPDVNRNIPFGCGATLSYNYIDLQLYNPTEQPFQLCFWLDKENLHGELRSQQALEHRYEVYESQHLMRGEIWGGYSRHNQVMRRVYAQASGELLANELLVENHAIMMYNPLLKQ